MFVHLLAAVGNVEMIYKTNIGHLAILLLKILPEAKVNGLFIRSLCLFDLAATGLCWVADVTFV